MTGFLFVTCGLKVQLENFLLRLQMEGGACPTDAAEAADLLNGLAERGLVGKRLAVSLGSEASLAPQLADGMGIERKAWHLSFVQGQVMSAVMMEDLESRADGASSSMQSIRDTQLAGNRKVAQTMAPTEPEVIVPPKPKRGMLGKSVRLLSGRIVMEEEVSDKIVEQLVKELLEEVEKAVNPSRATVALL